MFMSLNKNKIFFVQFDKNTIYSNDIPGIGLSTKCGSVRTSCKFNPLLVGSRVCVLTKLNEVLIKFLNIFQPFRCEIPRSVSELFKYHLSNNLK